uniref:molybdopterin molybdotransferase MoeA n=1 Tax=Halomonas sp. TaxID=1486246 RepID=UPI002601EAFD|nr:gephyrin-like molybdotransferase Glp [Halomonas sp.]
MTTLSCFELGERMLSVSEARASLLTLVSGPLATEKVALVHAHGRVLAEAVVAAFDVPGHTNAAMDGIALNWPCAEEGVGGPLAGESPAEWRLVGQALAGQPWQGRLGPGECISITTGAPLPEGANTVIMQEQVTISGDQVNIDSADRVKGGQHVRMAGEDITRGQVALEAGSRIDAAALGFLASLGQADVTVRCRPRVAVFSTGDEVTAPGDGRDAAAIYDANRYSLIGLLQEHGAEVMDLGIVRDDDNALVARLTEAAEVADLVISSGGVSVGQADYTKAAVESMGRLTLWRIALRPGRPMACGTLGEQQVPFLGLPGNPVACMVTFLCFVAPLLRVMLGISQAPLRQRAVADGRFNSRLGRTDFCRGRLSCDEDGRLHVMPTGAQGSGILSSMVAADCLVEVGDDMENANPGDTVTIHPLFRFP